MKKYCLTFFALILFFVLRTNAQSIDKIVNHYRSTHPFEQVYVQLDNNLYSGGDTIWFKAYILANTLPSIFSANLYADWFDVSGKLLVHQTYPITKGKCNGQFPIPLTYAGNKIHLLAYTRWMLNDTSTLFHKNISILPVQTIASSTSSSSTTESPKIVLQFFPEGGNLVAGVKNKVAFKSTDQYGSPLDINGIIKSDKKKFITNFSSIHDGMGYFYITPQEGIHYVAQYKKPSGDSVSVSLPQVQSFGIAMEVLTNNKERDVIIRKAKSTATNLNQLCLLATLNGYIKSITFINLLLQDTLTIPIHVHVSDFPSGVITFTVFDSAWNPLAERVGFIRNNNLSNNIPQLSVTTKNIDKKGFNTISLQYNDSVAANLSIAVTDARIPTDTSNNIISYLLLTGQLKGNVNNPAYYFEDSSLQRQQQLDLVMLTNRWRKYNWQQITKGITPPLEYKRDSAYFFLQGNVNVTNKKGKLPSKISVLIKNKDALASFTFPVNGNGYFADSSFSLYDTTSVSNRGKNNLIFSYLRLPGPAYYAYPFSENKYITTITEAKLNTLFNSLNIYKNTLPDVTVTTRIKQFAAPLDSIEDKYESQEFKNAQALKNVYVANDPTLNSYGGSANDFRYFILSHLGFDIAQTYPVNYAQTLQYFINEIPVPKDLAAQTVISDIVFLKYYTHLVTAPGGGGGSIANAAGIAPLSRNAGVIAIYTKRGFENEQPATAKKNTLPQIIGYTISKEFYSPDYNTIKNKDAIADYRKTLYWNPQINLDNKDNKNINLSFYNNDFAKRLRMIIEGIKADGTPIHIEKIVE